MIILPAIDIHNGTCVRLLQGDFATAHQVAGSYMDTARAFQNQGARWIHMVDLDGAKAGEPVNADIFLEVARETGLKVQLGGGIRSMQTIAYYLQNGISRVILGSAALKNPALVREAVCEYGERIAAGIDAKDQRVAAEGWLDESRVHYIDLAVEMAACGVKTIIFTDISRDGMLSGPNMRQLSRLNRAVNCGIIASGGIHTIEDIRRCKQAGLWGAICGKSLYQGTLELRQAILLAEGAD